MIIKTDFDIGQTVYVIEQKRTESKYRCHICLGTKLHQNFYHTSLAKSVTCICTSCSDAGAFYLHYWYLEKKVIIRHINAILNTDGYGSPIELNIYYSEFPDAENDDCCEQYILRDRIFATEEEAIRECQRKNLAIDKFHETGMSPDLRGKLVKIVVLDELPKVEDE